MNSRSIIAGLISALLLVQAVAQEEERITVPLGWYSFPELAQQLSSSGRMVECAPDLKECVALVHLRERSWQSVCEVLRSGLQVRLREVKRGRWRMERDPEVVSQEQKWFELLLEKVRSEWQKEMDRYSARAEIPLRYMPELIQLKERFTQFGEVWRRENSERFPSLREGEVLKEVIEAFDIGPVSPELKQWTQQWGESQPQVQGELALLAFDPDTRLKAILLSASLAATGGRGLFVWHVLWSRPELRPSVEEAMRHGYSVRVVPLSLLTDDPKIAYWLKEGKLPQGGEASSEWATMAVVYGLEWEDKTHPVVDFNLLPFVYLCTSEEAHDVHLMPLELVLARVYRDNNATERVYEWLGEEGKRAWAESQARTKQLKELPLAKERYEVGILNS